MRMTACMYTAVQAVGWSWRNPVVSYLFINLHLPHITGGKTPLFKMWFIINKEVSSLKSHWLSVLWLMVWCIWGVCVWTVSPSDVTNVFHGAKMITTVLLSCGLRVISGAECDFDSWCCLRQSRLALKPTATRPPSARGFSAQRETLHMTTTPLFLQCGRVIQSKPQEQDDS